MSGITVNEVLRSMGGDVDKRTAWRVGQAAAQQWRTETGAWPVKENRTKASGAGSHCFAIYPQEYRPAIIEIAKSIGVRPSPQRGLF